MRKPNINLFILLFLVTALQACSTGEVKKSLGLSRESPDEFMVISRPPLSIPPDFSLDPPAEFRNTNESSVPQEAKNVLFPTEKKKTYAGITSGENSLLLQAKVSEADSEIRNILAKEAFTLEREEEEKGILDTISDTFSPSDEDPVVNVDKEEERISQNIKEGKPVNEGEVEDQETSDKGFLNEWLGF